MTVHMIRVVSSASGMTLSEINAALDSWVSNHSEWVEDATSHHVTVTNTVMDGSGVEYYAGNYRFHHSDAKLNLLQKCGDKLQNKVGWYRLGYHVCDHDETDRADCSWNEKVEWTDKNVTIPSEVPDFA